MKVTNSTFKYIPIMGSVSLLFLAAAAVVKGALWLDRQQWWQLSLGFGCSKGVHVLEGVKPPFCFVIGAAFA